MRLADLVMCFANASGVVNSSGESGVVGRVGVGFGVLGISAQGRYLYVVGV